MIAIMKPMDTIIRVTEDMDTMRMIEKLNTFANNKMVWPFKEEYEFE